MIAILLAGLISIVHFFSEQFAKDCKRFYSQIASFSAGVGVSYLFLLLFPEFISTSPTRVYFLPILFGFVIWQVVERYIFQSASKNSIAKKLALEDSLVSFIYHFILGIVLVDIAQGGNLPAFLFFIPLVLFTALSTLPLDFTKNVWVKMFIALSTFIGSVAGSFFSIPNNLEIILMGFVIGTMTFTIIRHSIPSGKLSKPFYFLFGVLFYTLLIFFVT